MGAHVDSFTSGSGRLARALPRHAGIAGVLLIALLVRVAIAFGVAGMGAPIEDEQHYIALAQHLRQGDGYVVGEGHPTSMRPPLYPAFIASVWAAAGAESLQAVRWAQVIVALVGILLVYRIGCRWFNERIGLLAAAVVAIYPALLFSGAVLLTETLFTTLLLLFVFCVTEVERRSSVTVAALAGVSLGLAALTRSILWPFVLVAVPLIWVLTPVRHRRVATAAALVVGYLVILAPWAIRNTALNGTFSVVDTMGGLNLMMGNYAHTPEERIWDAIGMTGDRAWSATLPATAPDGSRWTEGKKEKWAQRQALAYMVAHPLTTARRSLIKFADFWGLERDFVAGVQRGYYQPPAWLAASGAAATVLVYVVTMVLAAIGICLAAPRMPRHVFLLIIVLFVAGVHSIVFGHSRYHLPVMPLLALYAAAAVVDGRWRAMRRRTGASLAAAVLILAFAAIWARELLVRDWDRIQRLVLG